ncbi:hypothetical protein DAPPUDRAFT_121932 [Daphnia pulex]|uniref:Uncharacterized protein n=1 Tax=Daphnia pulex TaxID=6669 RepID=E9I3J7_DAPPU|nr:hypothetical protein DAPPUDRAFT_121932 [Daphnia pulex]|eukprot:EFX61433.1 hypothetical protein DAPPUDRAFT_121932 [Daphnia pulex]
MAGILKYAELVPSCQMPELRNPVGITTYGRFPNTLRRPGTYRVPCVTSLPFILLAGSHGHVRTSILFFRPIAGRCYTLCLIIGGEPLQRCTLDCRLPTTLFDRFSHTFASTSSRKS